MEINLTMKTKAALKLMLVGLLVVVFADERAASATPQRKSPARKEVKVYFYHDPGEYIDLSPVTRLVGTPFRHVLPLMHCSKDPRLRSVNKVLIHLSAPAIFGLVL